MSLFNKKYGCKTFQNFVPRFVLILLQLLLINGFLCGQGQYDISGLDWSFIDKINRIYGLDPSLYNGMLYKSTYPKEIIGNQYFSSPNYLKGDVVIRGVIFSDIDLNYDIYKQELLLKYVNSSKGYSIISISKAWLESFSIGNARFILFSTSNNPRRIYQVLGDSSIRLAYFWRKDLKIDNSAGVLSFIKQKDSYVLMNDTLLRFKNNKSFLRLFMTSKQSQVKKYLHENKIKVNNSPDKIMEELINYCSQLYKM